MKSLRAMAEYQAQVTQHWARGAAALIVVGFFAGCTDWDEPPQPRLTPPLHEIKTTPANPAIDELAEAAAKHFRPDDFIERDDGELRLDIRDRFLFVEGTINSTTYTAMKQLLDANPKVQTLVLTNVPGSIDDEINLEAGRLIRTRGLTTYLPARAQVASGGTDLFLAGSMRIVERGARIGVHSWGGGPNGLQGLSGEDIEDGRDAPRGSPEHELYLNYYRDLDIPESFYWYTLEAASINDIHWMRKSEMKDYDISTHWRSGSIRQATTVTSGPPTITNPDYVTYPGPEMILRDVAALDPHVARFYDKYIAYAASDDGWIFLLAQDRISDEQLLRAYLILVHYLTDVPGSEFGADKTAVANAMAANGAILVLVNGADGDTDTPEEALIGQPLFQEEFPIEGSRVYIENDYERRDAGFEEILHLIHDFGIGTVNTDGALKPAIQQEIYEAAYAALDDGRWASGPEAAGWIEDLKAEGSIEQEYLASVIDTFYGLWGAWKEGSGGMWGGYVAKTREDLDDLDPTGLALINKFFDPYLRYMARIDPAFEGTFSMTFDFSMPYTHKSRYLTKARLLGDRSSSLTGNNQDNILIGNRGDNIIDGRDGEDVVQFSGASEDYEVETTARDLVVIDRAGRDGRTTLRNIEILRFTDTDIPAF